MPDLDTTLHLDMWKRFKRNDRLLPRLLRSFKKELSAQNIYGLEWGDPDVVEPLRHVRDQFVLPYVDRGQCAVEIGPGGGRWTRYLLNFKKLYVVDYHRELLAELQKNFNRPHMEFVKNSGTDFPAVPGRSIDYLFSFGTFAHLELDLIEAYLSNIKAILKPGANAVIQYSDKTKIMAQKNVGFSNNTPEKMRAMISTAGFRILEEDVTTLWHGSIVRFTL